MYCPTRRRYKLLRYGRVAKGLQLLQDLSGPVSGIETTLQCLFDWFCDNGMTENAAKTEFIVFGSRQPLRLTSEVSAQLLYAVMRADNEVRNLDVILMGNFPFQSRVDMIIGSVPGCSSSQSTQNMSYLSTRSNI